MKNSKTVRECMKQREIKFRGKRYDTGEWIYGSFMNDKTLDEGDISECAIWSNEGDGNWFDVKPETVCQFTGLTDKNGVEIYEGDYLVGRYKEDGKWKESLLEVQWCPKTLQWAVDGSFKQDGGLLLNLVDYFTFEELEVRGNVFENPKNKGAMRVFEEELKRAIDNVSLRPGLEGVGYDGGFIDGLEYAQELIDKYKNDAINEILTTYMEWALNLTDVQVANWNDERGDKEKTKARIRKEFIDYLNQKG